MPTELQTDTTHSPRAFVALLMAAMTYESRTGRVELAEYAPHRCAPITLTAPSLAHARALQALPQVNESEVL